MTQIMQMGQSKEDGKFREGAASVLYLENGLFIAVKTVCGFGASEEEAMRRLYEGLEWRGVRETEVKQ